MRVLMISKACVVGAYRRKLEEIAAFSDVELTAIIPPRWSEAGRTVLAGNANTRGYELIVEPVRLAGHHHLHFYPGLARHVRRLRPDIVHVDEEPYSLVTYLALRLARSAGARCLFFSWQNLYRRYPPPFHWTERYVLSHADFGICGNQEAVGVWRRKGYRGPVAVIPQFGVDVPAEQATQTSAAGLADGRRSAETLDSTSRQGEWETTFTLGFAGRLVEEKGVHLLVEAAAGLPGDWRLRVLGSGPAQHELEAQARRLGAGKHICFDDPIPADQVPGWMRQLDALVLPSVTRPNWKEQFGRVLVEAMVLGVPVVGSTSGEIPQVVGDAGLLFPEGDTQALRHALARLQSDPDLRTRLGAAGRQRVAEHYTQRRIAAETVDVYRQMLAQK